VSEISGSNSVQGEKTEAATGAELSIGDGVTVTSGSFHGVGLIAAEVCAVKGMPACGRSLRDP